MTFNRILIINPFGVGDCLFADPVIANIKKKYPLARISYIANDRTAVLIKSNPNVDNVISYERDEFVKARKKNFFAYAKRWFAFIDAIRQERCDVAVDFSLNRMFGCLAWIAGIKMRIGYDFKGRGIMLTHKIELKGYENKHVVEYYLDLLKFIDVPAVVKAMRLNVGKDEEIWAGQWLVNNDISQVSKLVAVVPGGGASWGGRAERKRWPAAKYAQLIDKMIADLGVTVILFGDAKEQGLATEITSLAASPVYSAVGQTSILQMAALLKYCSLAVLNDGGPLHVAVASGVKTISIFGPVDEKVYGPYPSAGHEVVKKNLACQPCYKRFFVAQCEHFSCLKDLSVEDVYRKVSFVYEHSVH